MRRSGLRQASASAQLLESNMFVQKLADVRQQRATAIDRFSALAAKDDFGVADAAELGKLETQIKSFTDQISRIERARTLSAETAQPVEGQTTPAQVKAADPYTKGDGLVLGGVARMLAAAKGNDREAARMCERAYGGSHPVTKAFGEDSGPNGGFLIAPDYMNEVIELLRAKAVVRKAKPLTIPMPRGTMTFPGQASAASASYGVEGAPIPTSEPGVNQIVASAKKLTALVPISNDLLRDTQYSTAADALVRDDLVKTSALREDLAFLLGDGTQGTPRGYLSFATGYGQNIITSNPNYTLETVSQELGGMLNLLEQSNVPIDTPHWFMSPRTKNYLFNAQNSLGVYVYRDEMRKGVLLDIPFSTTTQIPNTVTVNGTANTSYIFLAEMSETMIFDTLQLELFVSTEGTYTNAAGQTVSAVASDQTLIRAIQRHDFQMRHDASVAVNQGVTWAPVL
jgi:HK97 family phage major capsid protein